MPSLLERMWRIVCGRPDELNQALQLLDAKEVAVLADIRALRHQADAKIDRLAQSVLR